MAQPGLTSCAAALALTCAIAPPLAAQALSPQERRIRAAVDASRADQIAYLQHVVDIPSATLDLEGVRQVGAVFRASLDSLGLHG